VESPEASIVFPNLGVPVVPASPEQFMGIRAAEADSNVPIIASAPENVVFALQEDPFGEEEWLTSEGEEDETFASVIASPAGLSMEYLQGYSDAVQNLVGRVVAGEALVELEEVIPAAFDESQTTWGLQVTKAATSQFSGTGIKVAVLDTGMDLEHPDFAGRSITSRSFIENEPVHDRHGHGTHCIGTACGPQRPSKLPRYGVAYTADTFAGKVLSNRGSGTDAQILGGIEWAIAHGCEVLSMSLGAPVLPGQRALGQRTLIIAAAGNESGRPTRINPVGHPANCRSIMAVVALDERLQVASFSNGERTRPGGEVNIAAPGRLTLNI